MFSLKNLLKIFRKKEDRQFRIPEFVAIEGKVIFKASQSIFKIDAQNCTFVIQCDNSIVVCDGKNNFISDDINDILMNGEIGMMPFDAGVRPGMPNQIHGFKMRHVLYISKIKKRIEKIIKNEKI